MFTGETYKAKCPDCGLMFYSEDINLLGDRLHEHKMKGCNRYYYPGKVIGHKDDSGKPHMNLLLQEIPNALEEISNCLRLGEQKYGRGNWKRVENKEDRYLAALLRHLTAYHKGEKKDPESGRSHLAHVAVNSLFLLDGESE